MSVTERNHDNPLRTAPARPEPAAQGRPRRGRPARAHILMALAGLLTAVAVYVVLQDADPGQRVVVVTTELQSGTVVPPTALRVATVDVADELAARLIPAGEIDATVGQVVTNNLAPGDLLGRSDVRRPAAPEDRRVMALPLPRERAVAGDLHTGDSVDVIAVEDGVARYVATGLPVVATGGGDGLDANSWTLTVSVDERAALALARAAVDGELTVTRATGATPADPDAVEGGTSRSTRSSDSGDDQPAASRDSDAGEVPGADADDATTGDDADDATTGDDADAGTSTGIDGDSGSAG